MSIYLNSEAEKAAVLALGNDIGFGRIIQLAHQCWDEMLDAKHGIKGHSENWTLAAADLIRERRAEAASPESLDVSQDEPDISPRVSRVENGEEGGSAQSQPVTEHACEQAATSGAEGSGALAQRSIYSLLASAWFYGGWVAETDAEHAMQAIMEARGWWPILGEGDLFTRIGREMLSAAPVSAPSWQPIETAPRDGTLVDLWLDSGRRVTAVRWDEPPEEADSEFHEYGWLTEAGDYARGEDEQATHWAAIVAPGEAAMCAEQSDRSREAVKPPNHPATSGGEGEQ